MDTPSTLLIIDDHFLKMHLVVSYLQISQCYLILHRLLTSLLSFYYLAVKKKKAQTTRYKATVILSFFQQVVIVFIQWT